MNGFFRRGWWRPWNWSTRTWLLVMATSAIMAPFATRWICLWQVPDVTLPFDVDKFIGDEPTKDEDAFTQYAVIARLVSQSQPNWLPTAIDQATLSITPELDERLDQWMTDHADIVLEFELATRMEKSRGVSWKTIHFGTLIPVHQELRQLSKLAEVQALRCERAGDLERAWEWHCASLRCARHSELSGFPIATRVAGSIRFQTYLGISRWAAHPELSAERLNSARQFLLQDASSRLKLSDILKVDYLMVENTFHRDDFVEVLYPKWTTPSRFDPFASFVKRVFFWSNGQPELSLRLARQVLVNHLEQIDTPRHLRPPATRSEYPVVFDLDSSRSHQPGQMTSAGLAAALKRPLGQHLIKIELFAAPGNQKDIFDVDQGLQLDQVHSSLIDVVLAVHLFQRKHETFPATLEQLVPEFLDAVPVDDWSQRRAPLNYRRDSETQAIVWSVGNDGKDDGGDVDKSNPNVAPKDRGYQIVIHKPQLHQPE